MYIYPLPTSFISVITMRGLIRDIAKLKYGKVDVKTISEARSFVQEYNIYVAKKLLQEKGLEQSLRGKTKGYWQEFLKYLLPVEWAVWRKLVKEGKLPESPDQFYELVMKEYETNDYFKALKQKMEEELKKLIAEVKGTA